jgi:hypothetical protein
MAQTEISADVISLRYLKLLVAELGFHRVAQAGPHCLGLSSAGITGWTRAPPDPAQLAFLGRVSLLNLGLTKKCYATLVL